MARRFQRFGETDVETPSEINISPLIDVVFILLIFFIVTTVFVEETGVEIDKPRAATQQDLEKNSILLAVTRTGQVFYGGRDIGISGVRAVVARLIKQEAMPVIIQADRAAPTEATVSVLDEAKLAGAPNVFVSTIDD
ncbi:MAG: biopolymer transporter ExbD [Verrucomicrobiales bacterium]|jgi:biopolymer transport protein ExbD|nr:biopolymer transporter ExbD [Verrucomicrobiales bacterium]MBP9224298.1 biopolymer transporter ExbD [Verrucomicrobiales bacterium]HQZ28744.1 biopolymer transporter ExbD [Verrucomicrobiales bacterium]